MTPTSWRPQRFAAPNSWPHPSMATAVGCCRRSRRPACWKSHLINGFLRVVAECGACGAPFGLARANDAPPHFTILVTGHVVVPLLYFVDRMGEPPVWLMTAIFVPLTLALSVGLLRPINGGAVELMLNLHMLKSDVAER